MPYGDDRTPQQLLEALIERIEGYGAQLLEASYQGGNDEGGIEEVAIYQLNPDDVNFRQEMEMPSNEHSTWGDEDTVGSLANDLLSVKYGGWAWEGSAWGTFYVNTIERRAWEVGSETTEQPVSDPFNLGLPS